jgi:integrase
MLGCSLGLRRRDIQDLQWANADLRDPEAATLTYSEHKKGSRIRTLPIGPNLAREMIILRNTQPKSQKTIFSFKSRQAYNRFNRAVKIAGIRPRENVPFHAMRATAVKFMQAMGWSIEMISEITGDSIRTLQMHYSVPSRSELAEAAKEKEVV